MAFFDRTLLGPAEGAAGSLKRSTRSSMVGWERTKVRKESGGNGRTATGNEQRTRKPWLEVAPTTLTQRTRQTQKIPAAN